MVQCQTESIKFILGKKKKSDTVTSRFLQNLKSMFVSLINKTY